LIGLGIGAATDRRFDVKEQEMTVRVTDSQPSQSPSPLPSPAIGEDIRVWVTWQQDVWVEGRFRGVRDGDVIVLTGSGEHAVNLGAIREMRVNRPVRVTSSGSYWARGLAIGGVIDLTLIFIAGATCASTNGGCRFGQYR
jgi:hypothetical protein